MSTHIHIERQRDLTLQSLSAVAAVEVEWDDREGCWRILIDSDGRSVVLLAPELVIHLEQTHPQHPLTIIPGGRRD